MSTTSNLVHAKMAYAAFRAGDLPGALKHVHPDVQWIIGGNSTVSGIRHGVDEVVEWWGMLLEQGFATMPVSFMADGDHVIVLTESTTAGVSGEAVDVLEFFDGKLIRFHSLGDTERFERIWGVRDPDQR